MRGRGHQRVKIDRTLGVREEDARGKKRGGAEEEEHSVSISPVLLYCFASLCPLTFFPAVHLNYPPHRFLTVYLPAHHVPEWNTIPIPQGRKLNGRATALAFRRGVGER